MMIVQQPINRTVVIVRLQTLKQNYVRIRRGASFDPKRVYRFKLLSSYGRYQDACLLVRFILLVIIPLIIAGGYMVEPLFILQVPVYRLR